MRFDQFDDTAATQALMPDGVHECEVTKVKSVIRKADGREVTVMTLAAVEGDYSPIEKWLDPKERRDHQAAMQLLAALDLPADYDIDDRLVGRRVLVTAKGGIKKSTGEPTVYVNAIAAAEAAFQRDDANSKPAAKAPARTPAAKAARASDPDDIPF